MKLVHFRYRNQNHYGQLQTDESTIALIKGDIFGSFTVTSEIISLADVQILPPVRPRKCICIGLNYTEHAKESNIEQLPTEPLIFMCSPAAVIGHRETIQLNSYQDRIDYEAELAVIIKKTSKDLQSEEVKQAILGYTCANDVSNRHLQKRDGQFTRAKSFDTYKPLGPWIETDLDLNQAEIKLWQNGVLKQSSPIRDMIFSVEYIVQFLSSIMTLEPGDIILTGTPAGVGRLSPNDRIEIEISGLGRLINNVK